MQKIKQPYKTPENYFDSLENQILSQIKISKFVESKHSSASPSYFTDLEKNILSKTVYKPSFSVFKSSWFRYAASILFFILAGTGAYLNFSKNPLDDISSNEIAAYLESENLLEEDIISRVEFNEVSKINVSDVSELEIKEFLK